jgi:proton-translocating NAD(P)+ transhydrogenase subunit beta
MPDIPANLAAAQTPGISVDLRLSLISIAYLVASVLFIFGIKGLTHPRTAVRGNLMSAFAMLIAVVATLFVVGMSFTLIAIGFAIGTAIGLTLAIRIGMTEMPELVALFNGFGGLASLLVAGAALLMAAGFNTGLQFTGASVASGLIGAVTFSGSLVAFGKLRGYRWIPDGPWVPAQTVINVVLFVGCLALGYWLIEASGLAGQLWAYWLLGLVALGLGVLLTQPIGGADMPVVISLLNSYSGLAACATGFVIQNNVLIIAGALVGASGLILTSIMCKAMNRSLPNVIFGTMASGGEAMDADEIYRTVKSTSGDEVAMLLEGAQLVAFVPGYGMAASQAQHAVRDLTNLLEEREIEVVFGVHPVAGRMPGHMNVLLAEADIPYEKLLEMDEINAMMGRVDVCIVVGANDVVNPVARDPEGPIAGMPIIDADRAKTCIIIKRSLSPGFAGIPNPLFALENSLMLFGDGKKAFAEMIQGVKDL